MHRDQRMKHVIVTGGAGFLGSHVCDALLKRGYAVTAVDNFSTGRRENLRRALRHPHFDLVEADASRPFPRADIRFLSVHGGLRGVLHLACPAGPAGSGDRSFEVLEACSAGTRLAIDLALRYDARFILASSPDIYGDSLVHPQNESYCGNVDPVGPRSARQEAKRFAEAYVSAAIRHKGLNAAIARVFNAYGPRMRVDDGRMVPEFCLRALRGDTLWLHGDGLQTRSLCYVSDAVDGLIRLFESDVAQPVNLGNPEERTVVEVAETLLRMTGSRSAIARTEARPGDPRERRPDISRAKALLGWEPRIALREGLELAIAYFQATIDRPALFLARAAGAASTEAAPERSRAA